MMKDHKEIILPITEPLSKTVIRCYGEREKKSIDL